MSASTWSLLILLAFLWGGSFFFVRIAVVDLPPMTLVFLRVLLAAAALHLYLRGRDGVWHELAIHWRSFMILGLINNAIPFTLIFAGETAIGAGLASILNATTPLWALLVAHAFTSDEKLSLAKILGCALGLAGTVLLIGPDAVTGFGAPVWAQLAIIGAAISYGFGFSYGKRFAALPARVTAAGQLTASTIWMLPAALVVDRPWTLPVPPPGTMLAVAALAWLSTAFAYILYFRIMQRSGGTSTSLVTLLVPPCAILLGSVFLDEKLGPGELAAMALIATGLLCIDGRAGALLQRFTARNR